MYSVKTYCVKIIHSNTLMSEKLVHCTILLWKLKPCLLEEAIRIRVRGKFFYPIVLWTDTTGILDLLVVQNPYRGSRVQNILLETQKQLGIYSGPIPRISCSAGANSVLLQRGLPYTDRVYSWMFCFHPYTEGCL